MHERISESRPRPTPVQDQDKADVTGGGDLHIGVDDDIGRPPARLSVDANLDNPYEGSTAATKE